MKQIFLILIMALCIISANAVTLDKTAIGKDLTFGPYKVGYKLVQLYDNTRYFASNQDFEVKPGFTPRPIQVNIWYPAQISANQKLMIYSDYFKSILTEIDFKNKNDKQLKEILNHYAELFSKNDTTLSLSKELLTLPTHAFYEAKEISKKFPLILYSPGGGETAFENSFLIEYLVSHGFVIASVSSIGAQQKELTLGYTDHEAELRDMQFVYAYMRERGNVNPDQTGLIGFCMGSGINNLFACRDLSIKYIISFYNELSQENQRTVFKGQDPLQYLNPQLKILSFDIFQEQNRDDYYYSNVKYHDIVSVKMNKVDYMVFTSYYANKLNTLAYRSPRVKNYLTGYNRLCAMSLDFIQTMTSPQKENTFLRWQEKMNLLPSDDFVTIRVKKGFIKPPLGNQFMAYLEKNGIDAGVTVAQTALKNDPELIIFNENQMNLLGYQYVNQKDYQTALKIMKLICLQYPESFNAYDSLAETFYYLGDKENAIKNYERSLELNPKNTNAEKMIKQIKG